MEAKKSALRSRKPLSDCTNKVVAATSRKSSRSSDVKLLAGDGANGVAGCSDGSPPTDCSKALYVPSANELGLAASSTPVLLKEPSCNRVEDSGLKPQSFYGRGTVSKRKNKEGKKNRSSFSYTASKVQDNKRISKKHGYDDRPQVSTDPRKKKRNAYKNDLPQDFIERQRAYFAEIDAFELPEEEVESVLELD